MTLGCCSFLRQEHQIESCEKYLLPNCHLTFVILCGAFLLLLLIRSAHLAMISNGRRLLLRGHFCAVYNYARKADLGKGYRYPK